MNRTAAIAFIRAVLWGGFAGALPFLLVTIPVGLSLFSKGQELIAMWTMVLPLAVALPAALAGAVMIGLPITWLMIRSGREHGRFYILAGLVAGSLPFLLAGVFPDSIGLMAVSVPGGLAGAVAGWHWGRHRDAVIAARGNTA